MVRTKTDAAIDILKGLEVCNECYNVIDTAQLYHGHNKNCQHAWDIMLTDSINKYVTSEFNKKISELLTGNFN